MGRGLFLGIKLNLSIVSWIGRFGYDVEFIHCCPGNYS